MSEETTSDGQTIRRKLCDLAASQYRFLVNEHDINDVEIMRPDKESRGCFIGPLATIPVGYTEENDEGDEVLDLTGEDGMILYAVAALPFFAELVCWTNSQLDEIGNSPIPAEFIKGLRSRALWLQHLIDERDITVGAGTHGFHKFRD